MKVKSLVVTSRLGLLTLFCALAAVSQGSVAAATYQASARVTFALRTTAPGVELLNFVDDDGSNPFTTFAFVDPGGAPGSSADAQGSLASTGTDALTGAVNLSGAAAGLPGLPATLAFSTGWIAGGILAINNSAAPAALSIQLDWDWAIALGFDDPVLDSSLGQVVLDVFEDGVFLDNVVNELLVTPDSLGDANSGAFVREVTLGAAEARAYTFALSVTATGSAVAPAAVPEPASLYLMLAGGGSLLAARRRRARRSSVMT
jgi:hypothetical protein